MLKRLTNIFFLFLFLNSASWAGIKKSIHDEPLFQLGGGAVYSSIDLNRYTNSISYRGTHLRLVTHVAGMLYLSTEYSAFPVHTALPAWDDVHTKKIDINPQISFATDNNRTSIYVFSGVNRHEWKGRRTALPDLNQMGNGIAEGTYSEIKKWGVNVGCGFTTSLYENISLFADYRFCFVRAHDFEKVGLLDIMTTIGITYNIPYPEPSNHKKTFGIGKKIYKWTNKGGK